MIFLVSLIPESYARREMVYTRDFLNARCKKPVARCITIAEELSLVEYDYTDYFVIADYKSHPYYFNNQSLYSDWEEPINKIPKEQIVVWLGDARFEVHWDGIENAIGSYNSVFCNYNSSDMKGFLNSFKNEDVVPMTWKDMLRDLKYHYSLSETQCYPGDFEKQDKIYDLSYIMHGTVKHRLSHLNWLRYITFPMIVGDWENRPEPEVQDFVQYKKRRGHPIVYQKEKVFGKDWLELISKARYTIIADDDYSEFPAMLSARFWEAIRAECIPLIYAPKDPNRKIYRGYDCLQSCCYFSNIEDLARILVIKPMYHGCIRDCVRMYKDIYLGEKDNDCMV